ncbi:MAG: hypothetical protein U0V04_01670 [Spirosomataceae bacterium]
MFTLNSFYVFGATALIVFGDVKLAKYEVFFLENFAVYTTFFISLGRLFDWRHSE